MLKKVLMALVIAAASFNFASTSDAEEYNSENYCCGNHYDNDCCDYYNGGNYYNGDYRERGCCR